LLEQQLVKKGTDCRALIKQQDYRTASIPSTVMPNAEKTM